MFSIKPWIWLALFVTLQVQAQSPAPVPSGEETAKASFKKGVEAFQKKDFDAASKFFMEVPELGGYLSLYKHWYLGQALLQAGKAKESETEFAKVESSQASSELKYQAQFFHGEALAMQGKHAEAVKQYLPLERKWRRSYRYPEVVYRLMQLDQKLGKLNFLCNRARKLYSDYPAHATVLSWGHDLKQVEIGGQKLSCATDLDDFASRVRSLQFSGESEKAHAEILEVMAKAPETEKFRLDMILANYLVGEGSVDDALNLLIRYYPLQKANFRYLTMLGKAAARSGEYQTAVGAYERAYQTSPKSRKGREALYQAAFLSYQFQDYDGAVRKFQQFIQANPKSGLARDAQWHLAWLQYLRADYNGALTRFDAAFKAYKKQRRQNESLGDRLLYWMAMSHVRLKQFSEARADFKTIIARNSYSYYGLAAQARLESLPELADEVKPRGPAAVDKAEAANNVAAEEEKESEEALAEQTDDSAPQTSDEVEVEDSLIASEYKDPAVRARIDVAQKLVDLDLQDLARWELWEVERRTRNRDYLRRLISAYESIGSYNRSATIAELSFADERDRDGIENGRALWTSMYPQAFRTHVTNATKQFGTPQEWVWAIMRAESLYKPDVISPVGAKGLMQLMPYTAKNLNRLVGGEEGPLDLMDPQTNIRLGTQYLGRLQQKFKGHLPLVAAAYNGGPHRVEGWLVNFGHLETDEFVEHIPFLETRNYVKKVVRNHTLYRRVYAKDMKPVDYLAKPLGVPIPSRASTRESWESL